MHLQDLTGEGVAGQFVLFDHVASGIAAGSVLGYSARSDRAVQYSVERTQNEFDPVAQLWAVEVFDRKPSRPGYWKFTWEPGHGEENWIDEEVHFDAARQLFVEKGTVRPYPGSSQVHCGLDKTSLEDFLDHMREVTPDGIDFTWLEGLISKASPNRIEAAGMVPAFNGAQESLALEFQVSSAGSIRINLSADSDLVAALQNELKAWCSAN